MMGRLSVACVALFLAGAVEAEPYGGLRTAMAAYEKAQIEGDRGLLMQLLADDYVLVNGAGGREDKRQFIADLVDPGFKLRPYTIERPVIRRWNGGAVAAGIAHETGTSAGKAFDACIRFADTWKQVRGRWQVVFTQVARMPPPTAAGCGA